MKDQRKPIEANSGSRMQVLVSDDELYNLKRAALDARISLTKYVRLKLGLDSDKKKG